MRSNSTFSVGFETWTCLQTYELIESCKFEEKYFCLIFSNTNVTSYNNYVDACKNETNIFVTFCKLFLVLINIGHNIFDSRI